MNHSGDITSNETWYSAGNPHVITATVTVKSGAILTIEPGCIIKFDDGTDIRVGVGGVSEGRIIAEGTSGNWITFTSNEITPANDDGAIYFQKNTVTASSFKYCEFEYMEYFTTSLSSLMPTLEHVIFHDCKSPLQLTNYANQTYSWEDIAIIDCVNGLRFGATATITIKNLLIANLSDLAATGVTVAASAVINIENATLYGTDKSWASTFGANTSTATATLNIKNSIITNWGRGLWRFGGSTLNSTYNDVWDNTIAYAACSAGTGDISVDPKIINLSGSNIDDYRLKSQYGRWNGSSWVTDAEDSPCIDVGDPGDDYSNEPEDNGNRINMGFDGNTQYASLTGLPSTEEIEDIDNDFRTMLIVFKDMDNDFRMIGQESIADFDNDFRTIGAVLSDILNDFRMIGEEEIKDVNNKLNTVLEVLSDIDNKFNTTIAPDLQDILNKFNMCNRIISDVTNQIGIVSPQLKDISNDFRTIGRVEKDISNDFRMICPWQICPLS